MEKYSEEHLQAKIDHHWWSTCRSFSWYKLSSQTQHIGEQSWNFFESFGRNSQQQMAITLSTLGEGSRNLNSKRIIYIHAYLYTCIRLHFYCRSTGEPIYCPANTNRRSDQIKRNFSVTRWLLMHQSSPKTISDHTPNIVHYGTKIEKNTLPERLGTKRPLRMHYASI